MKYFFYTISLLFLFSCSEKEPEPTPVNSAYTLQVPAHFPKISIPENNPLTQKGVALGRKLFFDKRLSADNTVSCASCHQPNLSFSDGLKYPVGINNQIGNINSMALVNLAWSNNFFWDGRAATLEDQALEPIENPIEMGQNLEELIQKLEKDTEYPKLFFEAFNERKISKSGIAKALAQFERTLISSGSIYDAYYVQGDNALKTASQLRGAQLFFSETADCFHCHGGPLGNNPSSKPFANNGLNEAIQNTGRGVITNNQADFGLFKVPTLRNISFTAPYMHDGRFNTLEEVVEFYSTGIKNSETLDPILQKFDRVEKGGIALTAQQKKDLVEFLKTFNDSAFIVRQH